MEDVLDMSLDDYINSFEKSKPKETSNVHTQKEESKFKEGRRSQSDNEDEEKGPIIDCNEDGYVSLGLNNDSLSLVKVDSNDLRNKIGGRFPNSNSQQWRLMQPNVMQSRPAGMPPLIPTDIPQSGLNGNRGKWRNYNNKYRNVFGRQNCNNNNNYRNYGRIQRFNNNSRSNLNSKNVQLVLQQLKERNPMILYSDISAPDITIEATTNQQKMNSNKFNFTIPKIVNPNLPPVVVEREPQPKNSEAMKSLLGVSELGLRNEMLPALAGKLLEFLNGVSPAVHKPQYDMKIQKEIHNIQKKPLLYKCPGGEVLSSDGVGIPNCKILPKASGVSLNNRFA